jgi:hypothetical protein
VFEISYAAIATPATAPPLKLFPLLVDDTPKEAALGLGATGRDVDAARLTTFDGAIEESPIPEPLPPLAGLAAEVADVSPVGHDNPGLCTPIPVGPGVGAAGGPTCGHISVRQSAETLGLVLVFSLGMLMSV